MDGIHEHRDGSDGMSRRIWLTAFVISLHNAKQMVKGSGSTVGLPELRAGTVLHIGGLDECFNGRYFVTGTTHTIGGSGYTTKFDCRLEEL